MRVEKLFLELKSEFFAGVPDSALRPVCDYLMSGEGISSRHVIAANEGNCAALAAGYYMATGKVPTVYLQNSGIGNIANPVISLMNEQVYGIPCLFLVGWRGEPGRSDEPQHWFQGQITVKLLEDMGIRAFPVTEAREDTDRILKAAGQALSEGKQAALVFSPGTFAQVEKRRYGNLNTMVREDAIRRIAAAAGEDILVASTGKISRELFEIREQNRQGHSQDFLTVGSMGHSSSIAMGIAMQKRRTRVWCLDGDGALLMHMGAMAVIGSSGLPNFVHVVFNNGAHESVGGMPTVMGNVDLRGMARAAGYENCLSVSTIKELDEALLSVGEKRVLTLLEVKTAIGSRPDLGRPTVSPKENLRNFMEFLSKKE